MSWVLVIILFDFLHNREPFVQNATVPMKSLKECKEQRESVKRDLTITNTVECVRRK